MAIDWQAVLLAFGGQVALLAALAWLFKSLISNRLSKEADAFRIQLQAQANVEIERLRGSLQIAAAEHQVRFSKLHEKRAEVILELYRLVVEAPIAAGKFIWVDMRDHEQAKIARDKVGELFSFLSLNRIYLPSPVCGRLDDFERKLRHSVVWVTTYWTRVEHPNEQMMEEQTKVMREASTALETDLPAIKRELESEFRGLLGVEPARLENTSLRDQ